MSLNQSTRLAILEFLRQTRLIDALQSLRSDPVTLMYHRFGQDGRRGALPISALEQQLVRIRSRHHVFSCSAMVRRLSEGTLPRDSVVITIDDCYEEVYTEVFPILKRLALPATLYVVTEFVDGRSWLWPDRIAWIFFNSPRLDWTLSVGSINRSYSFDSIGARLQAWSDCADWLLTMPPDARDDHISLVGRELLTPVPEEAPPGYRSVSWAQLREMMDAGMEVGSHGCSHTRLTMVDQARLTYEATESRMRIEGMVDRAVRSFAYPHGTDADVDDRVVAAVKGAGYTSAVMGVHHTAAHDHFRLPRYAPSGSFTSFVAMLAGVAF